MAYWLLISLSGASMFAAAGSQAGVAPGTNDASNDCECNWSGASIMLSNFYPPNDMKNIAFNK